MWMKEEFTWRTEYQYGGHQPKFVLLPITVMAFSTTIPKLLDLAIAFCLLYLLEMSYAYICIGMYLPAFMHDHKGSTLRTSNPLF